jgi:lipopolysaccharide biosynthesis regulator YciM
MAKERLKAPTANEIQIGGDHYKAAIEHWDFVLANDIPYMEAQIMKYLCRWKKKNGLMDLYKALHFLAKLIEHNGGNPAEVLAVPLKG